MRKLALALAALLLLAAPAAARRNQVIPVFLAIEGYVGQKPADPGSIMTKWVVRTDKQTVDFYVTKLEVLTGDTSYMQIITQLEPYKPTLTLKGTTTQRTDFLKAAPGKKVSMRAYLRRDPSTRYLMVDTLEVQM